MVKMPLNVFYVWDYMYLKVECMNRDETNFSRTAKSQRLWQGAICHIWTSQFDKHCRHSQKQLQKYSIRDIGIFGFEVCSTWHLRY